MAGLSCNGDKISRQPVDKNALMNIIKQLAEVEGKHAQDTSSNLLRDWAEKYSLVEVDTLSIHADSNMVKVCVVRNKDFPHIIIQLPVHLQRQLTFADFDHVFGAGIESPRPKEPISFSVMFRAAKVGDIRVAVNSHRPPNAVHPEIYEILIM
ncbi:hypothetical protein CLV57_2380 [Mucilaginibacter auburnensis]|uniref:Uncharacterized protein n=2 Tax=Mucilaginibacter auburnensis TaxID=1457233 RepID=A0A2H9VLQ9_9SPHI|nr:hypothetical protein CLV57_2380 [Mucilaginibacter auburnensis]